MLLYPQRLPVFILVQAGIHILLIPKAMFSFSGLSKTNKLLPLLISYRSPLKNLIKASKAAKTDILLIKATVSYTW